MKQDKALQKFKKNVRSIITPNTDFSYLHRINQLEDSYNRLIKDKRVNLDGTDNIITSFWNIIKECVSLYQNGLFSESVNEFYEKIFCSTEYIDVTTLEEKSRLYRIRKADYGGLYKKTEMFHIPFSKRHIVANERFSVTGMPSLYLSESTYICWEEMGNPNFDTCNVSLFMNDSQLKLVNLTPILESFDPKKIYKYPLAYLCTLGTNYPNASYKEEYLIPQLLMQSLFISNKTGNEIISGIRYISTKAYTERPLFPLKEKEDLKRYFNYVFPAIGPYDEDGLSKYLTSLFSWSSPETYGRYRLETAGLSVIEPKTTDTYKISAFYQMENLCNLIWTRDNMLHYTSLEGALSF